MRLSDNIRREAAQWLVRLEVEHTAASDEAYVTWLGVDPRHEMAMALLLEAMPTIASAAIAKRLGQKRTSTPSPLFLAHATTSFAPSRRWLFATATAGVGAAAFGAIFLAFPNRETYAAGLGEQKPLHFKDGSEIILNTQTQIGVQFSSTARRFSLDRGEAYFASAADPSRPLIVETSQRFVTVQKARFSIRSEQSVFSVLVAEGEVQVSGGAAGDAPVTVSCGQEFVLSANLANIHTLSTEEVESRLTWRTGMLEFLHAPLSEVASEISRYTAVNFIFDDPRIAEEIFAGSKLPANDADLFIARVQRGDPTLIFRRRGNDVHIARRSSAQRE